LTTKKLFFRGIVEELLWFMKGETDSKLLENVGVNIWKGNTSREYLDSHGFHKRENGDIGPGYGHQWRYWNAMYSGPKTIYDGVGIDQLQNCVNSIRLEKYKEEHSRRNLMIAWNPEQISEMSLPPCHVLVQFYLDNNNNTLSLHMYQRSADMFLGVPFNIASYALLLNIISKLTGTFPKNLIMSFGDAHIYKNHIEAVKEQLNNAPFEFPTLSLNNINEETKIIDITVDNIKLQNYSHHKAIKATMAV
jgi:thymidylate synthase